MSKGLEELKKIKNYKEWTTVVTMGGYEQAKVKLAYNDELKASFSIIEKELKESEIIKHFIKSLGLTFIFSSDKTIVIVGGDDFEYWYKCETQEEYDSLKEVLL